MRAQPDVIAERAWPGTSCSSPQLAAAAALLHQAFPGASAMELRDKLTSHARSDTFVTKDVNAWGAGKLDIAAAIAPSPLSREPPKVSIVAPGTVAKGETFSIKVRAEAGDREQLRVRWDFDYDGHWDTDFEPVADKELRAPNVEGTVALRLEVHDASGNLAGASTVVTVGEAQVVATTATTDASDGGCQLVRTEKRSHTMGFAVAALLSVYVGRRRYRLREFP